MKFNLRHYKEVAVFAEKDPAQIPWGECNVDYVVESTGVFTTLATAHAHIKVGPRLRD